MGKKKTKLTLEKKYNLTGWAFLLPAAILIFVFCFYPMAQAILLSFRKTGGVFTGVSNYTRVFQDKTFQQCLFNTFFYFLIQVPIMLVLALILAQLLNSPKIRCKGLFRTLIFLPCATSLVSYSMIFKSLFAPDGVVNRVLTGIGLSSVHNSVRSKQGRSCEQSSYRNWIILCRLVPEYMAGSLGNCYSFDLEMDRIQYGILSCRITEY